MIDAAAVKQGVDLLALVGRDVVLKRKASTHGGEWAGACPWCGGRDRFLVWPNADPPTFWCRQCNRGGDALAYVMQLHGLDFRAACETLTGPGLPTANRQSAQQAQRASRSDPPGADWQDKARCLVADCEAALWSDAGTRARAWLTGERGLTEPAIRAWELGYCPKDGQYHGLFAYRGIVIPWLAAGQVWKVQIRRPATDPKERYKQVGGAGGACPGLYGADKLTGNDDCFVTEGELDAVLLWQEAGGLADVLTLGNAAGRMADRWLPLLLPVRRFWIATDNDEGGHQAAAYWLNLTGERGRRILPPSGAKDIGEAWQAGADLLVWILAAMGAGGGIDDNQQAEVTE